MTPAHGPQGTPTSAVETSPRWRKRRAIARRRQARYWAARSGPVTTTTTPPAGHASETSKEHP